MPHPTLQDFPVNIKLKLALLWASLMFLYIYADYFELMTPGKLESMMQLKTPMGPTSPNLLVIFGLLLIVPALMIAVSALLTPHINRWCQIIVGFFYSVISILIIISSFDSDWHRFYVLYNFAELCILVAIIWQAWKWPKHA